MGLDVKGGGWTEKRRGARQMADGRLVAKGYQDPDLRKGLVDTSGCVSLRSSHLQVISLRLIKKSELWSVDIKNAFLQGGVYSGTS